MVQILTFLPFFACLFGFELIGALMCILWNADCARALLSVPNVEVNVQNKLGDTPLHNAAWKGHAEVVELLLEKGMPLLSTLHRVVTRPTHSRCRNKYSKQGESNPL